MRVGETRALQVTRQNTNDFMVSVNPASGSGCEKNGANAVVCTPTAAGTYNVTVTATADTSKNGTAVLTVTPAQTDSTPTPGDGDDDDGDSGNNSDDGSIPSDSTVDKALLLQFVNSYRAEGYYCGDSGYFSSADPVTWDDTLALTAYDHSLDMFTNNFFDHAGSDGSSTGSRLTRRGYTWTTWGENIASGYLNEETVVNGWMASPGHCANIMNPAFTEMGVARVGNYWTQDLAAPW